MTNTIDTVSKNRADKLAEKIIDVHDECVRVQYEYFEKQARNRRPKSTATKLCGVVQALFKFLEPNLQHSADIEELAENVADLEEGEVSGVGDLRELVGSGDPEEAMAAFDVMNQYLYEIQLFQLDSIEVHDKTNVEADNERIS